MAKKKAAGSPKVPLREAVLRAAIELVEMRGAGALTLDAVAALAGVSKGGLMHHFKTKEALLTALIEQVANTFELERRQSVERLMESKQGAAEEVDMLATYLDRAFAGLGVKNQGAMALFAAAVHQPALLQPVRDYFARRTEEMLMHSRHPRAALACMMLADGIWLFDALGIPEWNGALRAEIGAVTKSWITQIINAERDSSASALLPAASDSALKRKVATAGGPSRRGRR